MPRKPGDLNPAAFKKGFDPRRNLGGRAPAHKKDFAALARENAQDALDFLKDLIHNDEASIMERRKAAEFVIEQGYGKAVDRIAVQQLSGGGDNVVDMDLGQLRSKVANLLAIEGEAHETFEGEGVSEVRVSSEPVADRPAELEPAVSEVCPGASESVQDVISGSDAGHDPGSDSSR